MISAGYEFGEWRIFFDRREGETGEAGGEQEGAGEAREGESESGRGRGGRESKGGRAGGRERERTHDLTTRKLFSERNSFFSFLKKAIAEYEK